MNIEVILAILFVVFLIVFVLLNRQKIAIQKIIFPVLYMILYRSNLGIRFIDRFSKRYKEYIIFLGYVCVGLGFVGMIFITINMIVMLFTMVSTPEPAAGVSLVLPFTNIPGIGYLSFLHWIVAIFILALIHEFSHGIVARAHGLKIKSSGFAFLAFFAPIIPAAFVEPDEKELEKKPDIVQYSIFAAGPMANIFLALILLLAMPYVADPNQLAPFEDKITEPVGFSFDLTNKTMPAAESGLESGMIIDSFNNHSVADSDLFLEQMHYCSSAGEKITLGTKDNDTYSIVPAEIGGRPMIGISNIRDERRVKPEYGWLKHPFYWTKGLFRWLFLLNLFIGLFNLLPLAIVDGGRMLKTFLDKAVKDKKKAAKIWGMVSFFLLFILLYGLFTSYFGNPFAFLLS